MRPQDILPLAGETPPAEPGMTDDLVALAPAEEPSTPDLWVIWSHEHRAWWGPKQRGYTEDLREAGRYTKAEAAEITLGTLPYGIEVPVPARSAEVSGTSRLWGHVDGIKDLDTAGARIVELVSREPSSAPWVEMPEPIRHAFGQAFARDGQQVDLQRLVGAVARYIGGIR